jgi:23S rRNA (uridine2552-2'-O)-methyltransferase
MSKRSKSSGRWLAEHAQDEYVKRAQREGWRSRAVFKLEEINRVERLVRPGIRCVDLGAAPGGWSQYAAKILRGSGRLVATDLLPMEPIAGVEFVQGDFREADVLAGILAAVGAEKIDLVLSDMAPNMAGIESVDQARAIQLSELALEFSERVLGAHGALILKLFQGAGFAELVRLARQRFATVKLKKPKASRSRSAEVYLVARGFRMV